MRKKPKSLPPNPVAKYAHTVNQAAVFTDRKKALKKGYRKHKQWDKGQWDKGQGDAIAA